QGEKDGKKDPDPPPTKATIALLWKAPQQADELIPQRFLSPGNVQETFVLQTAFPPDDRSVGYERGNSISKAWDQSATDAALEVADYVTTRLGELAGLNDDPKNRDTKVREFCQKFAEHAFRRPLTDEQKSFYLDRQLKLSKDPNVAVKRVVLAVLMSPRFL